MLLWLFPLIFASLYGLIGGVEFMLPVFGLLDSSERTQRTIARWFSPVWEVTNVFFVAAITSFAAIFPLELPQLPNGVRAWLLIAGALLALRAALVLTFFYARGGKGIRMLAALAVVSFSLPAALSQVILQIVSPDCTQAQQVGAALMGVLLALALCASLFCLLHPKLSRYRHIAQLSWAGSALSFLLINRSDASLVSVSVVFGTTALGVLLVSALSRARWALLACSVTLYSVLAVELAIRQWPYVIFAQTTYQSVQAPSSIQAVIAWGSLVGLLIITPPLVWLGLTFVRRLLADL